MMRCDEFAELATHYMEKALPLKGRLAARVHLLLCLSCRLYVTQLRRTVHFLGQMPGRPPADEGAILARLTEKPGD